MYSELKFETEYRENVYNLFSLEDSFFVLVIWSLEG